MEESAGSELKTSGDSVGIEELSLDEVKKLDKMEEYIEDLQVFLCVGASGEMDKAHIDRNVGVLKSLIEISGIPGTSRMGRLLVVGMRLHDIAKQASPQEIVEALDLLQRDEMVEMAGFEAGFMKEVYEQVSPYLRSTISDESEQGYSEKMDASRTSSGYKWNINSRYDKFSGLERLLYHNRQAEVMVRALFRSYGMSKEDEEFTSKLVRFHHFPPTFFVSQVADLLVRKTSGADLPDKERKALITQKQTEFWLYVSNPKLANVWSDENERRVWEDVLPIVKHGVDINSPELLFMMTDAIDMIGGEKICNLAILDFMDTLKDSMGNGLGSSVESCALVCMKDDFEKVAREYFKMLKDAFVKVCEMDPKYITEGDDRRLEDRLDEFLARAKKLADLAIEKYDGNLYQIHEELAQLRVDAQNFMSGHEVKIKDEFLTGDAEKTAGDISWKGLSKVQAEKARDRCQQIIKVAYLGGAPETPPGG